VSQVDRADAVEVLGRLVGGVGEREHDAGVVEGHVEPAELGDGAVDERGDLVFVGDVAGDAERAITGGGQLVGRGAQRLSLTSASTTAAPAVAKARAVSRPMPAPAPVTRATWPLKS
jgi:hypothetical protein